MRYWFVVAFMYSAYAQHAACNDSHIFSSLLDFFHSHFNTPPYILQLELMISALRERAKYRNYTDEFKLKTKLRICVRVDTTHVSHGQAPYASV